MSDGFYSRGIQYDAQHRHLTADVDFYRSVAREQGGPILELACGTGRILAPLSSDGHDVAGVDAEESMLAIARPKLPKSAQLLCGDMRRFDLGRRFRLVILAFNSIGHLYQRADVESCLDCVKTHLAADGLFVLSMFNPDLRLLARGSNEVREVSRYPDPESTREVVVTETASYDRASQVITSHWHYSIGTEQFRNRLRLRIFFPQELEALLHYAGFEINARFGNFDRSQFSSNSPHQIILAAARQRHSTALDSRAV